jgi:tellurite resistance protein TerC
MMHDLWPWIAFNGFILVMLAIDLFIHRDAKDITMKEATVWSVFWISLALLFNVYLYYARGYGDAVDFLTGYLIEKSLSVDNLFVFLLIFKYFETPKSSLHKVLFWGVLGAIVMRALFIWLGIALITHFHWIIYVFGAFLVFTGIKLAIEKDKKLDPEKNIVLRLCHRLFRFVKTYENHNFFVVRNTKTYATPLLLVLVAIETTDLIFAVDSIPAILAITTDPFIVYTSNIFAILGLRSLYFVLSHVMGLFHYLHYALSFILTFIGVKMLITDIIKIPTVWTLGIVFTVLLISVIASIWFPEDRSKGHV